MSKPLDATQLRAVVSYDPETGDFNWIVSRSGVRPGIAGSVEAEGYRVLKVNGQTYKAHRLAWLYMTGEWPEEQIDHINGNRSDNRFANLRPASLFQNARNRRLQSNNSYGFKGVEKIRSKEPRYRARINKEGRRVDIGYFSSAKEAHEAYVRAAVELYGEFARAE